MKKIINQFISSDEQLDSFSNIFTNSLIPFTKKKIKKDDFIFHPDSPHKYSYYVKTGLIKISAISGEGKEKALFFHEPGSIFGFQNLNHPKLTITQASAVIDSELYQFEYEFFNEFLRNSPDYFSFFLSYIFQMMVLQTQEVINLSLYTTNERLAGLLLILEEENNKDSSINALLPYSNQELASMLGVCRNSISNAIGILHNTQIIEKKRNGVIIKDLNRLKEFASDFQYSYLKEKIPNEKINKQGISNL
jgi:CRP-like cAMP-binding protein